MVPMTKVTGHPALMVQSGQHWRSVETTEQPQMHEGKRAGQYSVRVCVFSRGSANSTAQVLPALHKVEDLCGEGYTTVRYTEASYACLSGRHFHVSGLWRYVAA